MSDIRSWLDCNGLVRLLAFVEGQPMTEQEDRRGNHRGQSLPLAFPDGKLIVATRRQLRTGLSPICPPYTSSPVERLPRVPPVNPQMALPCDDEVRLERDYLEPKVVNQEDAQSKSPAFH
jgi:hypothetical protein